MATVKATWTGYVGFSADGAVHVPGCVEEVDQQVAQANPHFAPTGQTYTPRPLRALSLKRLRPQRKSMCRFQARFYSPAPASTPVMEVPS